MGIILFRLATDNIGDVKQVVVVGCPQDDLLIVGADVFKVLEQCIQP